MGDRRIKKIIQASILDLGKYSLGIEKDRGHSLWAFSLIEIDLLALPGSASLELVDFCENGVLFRAPKEAELDVFQVGGAIEARIELVNALSFFARLKIMSKQQFSSSSGWLIGCQVKAEPLEEKIFTETIRYALRLQKLLR